ncbi:putative bifunctional diguanylate cyclase/phosphodiesterase [Parvibium lacunae]|uniref:EAL domain-containing protein n=1 Tax=Parvibium lacunae TaxID=1888893 RepID=A0A368L759_9BURK|nr:GGDEF domain-containing response regulator [Parvibium lacunae]RCS59483.1 EAL domain-containing protein [Parvibium lacunae]
MHRILLVDDNEDDALLASAQIERALGKFSHRRVENALDFRHALVEEDWDLIICDHSMPQFDSRAALMIVKELKNETPFIVYSGHYSEQEGIQAMQRGASDFVEKGSPARLIPVVQRELNTSRLRRAKSVAENEIESLSRYDKLTRLPNRQFFLDIVDAKLTQLQEAHEQAALLYIDLDRFMRINESFGYQIGDFLIQTCAARLKSLPYNVTICRLSQDEFTLLLENCASNHDAIHLAEQILGRLGEPCYVTTPDQQTQELYLSASIGIAMFPLQGIDGPELIKNAESAMYRAKSQGGQRYLFYADELSGRASRRYMLELGLRHAISRGQIYLEFQPVFDLASEKLIGTEALVRWRNPEFGLIRPDEFIPLADETGMIIPLGEWVLREACLQTQRWHAAGYSHLNIAINFSAIQFRQEKLAEKVLPIILETGIAPDRIEVEITETVAMQDAESAIQTLKSLKNSGVRVAIDDFGTGYSSLSYLRKFPIDILKIDKSFVRDIETDPDDASIVRVINALGHALRLEMQAEGVENLEQLKFLQNEGCQRAQGYLFSMPRSAEAMTEMLAQYPSQFGFRQFGTT